MLLIEHPCSPIVRATALALEIVDLDFYLRHLTLQISHVVVHVLYLELQSTRQMLDVIAIGLLTQGLARASSMCCTNSSMGGSLWGDICTSLSCAPIGSSKP